MPLLIPHLFVFVWVCALFTTSTPPSASMSTQWEPSLYSTKREPSLLPWHSQLSLSLCIRLFFSTTATALCATWTHMVRKYSSKHPYIHPLPAARASLQRFLFTSKAQQHLNFMCVRNLRGHFIFKPRDNRKQVSHILVAGTFTEFLVCDWPQKRHDKHFLMIWGVLVMRNYCDVRWCKTIAHAQSWSIEDMASVYK